MSRQGEFRWPLRVYIEDTDAGGIVFYVNYLKFMERARTEFLRQLGFGKAAVMEEGGLFVVHSLNIDYRSPARLDDQLTVSARVRAVGKATVLFEQCVYRDDSLLCRGDVKIASVHRDTLRPIAMPGAMHAALQSHLSAFIAHTEE